jgi:hypothetical protein
MKIKLVGGLSIEGTEAQIRDYVTKSVYIPISEMADEHLKNTMIKKAIEHLNNLRNKELAVFLSEFPEFLYTSNSEIQALEDEAESRNWGE